MRRAVLLLLGFLTLFATPGTKAQTPPPNTIVTVAGGGTNSGAANTWTLTQPPAAIRDTLGNTYFSDSIQCVVYKVDTAGTLSIYAGNGIFGVGGDGGPASSAQLTGPQGLALDANGNLFIADSLNNRIRRVDVNTHIITTVAGSEDPFIGAYTGDGGLATLARLNQPYFVTVDANGNLFISDTGNNVVRRVDAQTQVITTYAGDGLPGTPGSTNGDGSLATSAQLNLPVGLAVDGSGNLYIADGNDSVIRLVNAQTLIISTYAGSPALHDTFGGDGGPAASAGLATPTGIFLDDTGNLYIADQRNERIRFVASTGTHIISTIVGNGALCTNPASACGDGGAATSAMLNHPTSVFLDNANKLLIADSGDQRIRVVSAGNISNFGGGASGGDGGPAASANLGLPNSLVVDGSGNLFILEQYGERVRRVDATSHNISTFAGTGARGERMVLNGDGGQAVNANLVDGFGIAMDTPGNFYIVDIREAVVRKIATTGIITTVVGNRMRCGEAGNPVVPPACGDGGPATSASLLQPAGVAVDSLGNIYISDVALNRIRVVNPQGVISNFAGTGTAGYSGDFGDPTLAKLNAPFGMAVDSQGNLFFADSNNNVIREVNAQGASISTYAFDGNPGFGGDGGSALEASMTGPQQVALDSTGNLYIGGGIDNVVRRVDAQDQSIITVAGDIENLAGGYFGDKGPSVKALIGNLGAAIDKSHNLYIADGFQRIRKVNLLPVAAESGSFTAFPPTLNGTSVFLAPTQEISFTNSGLDDLILTVTSPAPGSAFQVQFGTCATPCIVVVPPGGFGSVEVSFAPLAGGPTGPLPGALTLTTNDPANPSFNFTLSGTATNTPETLNVTVTPNADGIVSSTPNGISCGVAPPQFQTCSVAFPQNAQVTLTAGPATSGFTFTGWSGAGCTGTADCVVPMTQTQNVTATFTTTTVGNQPVTVSAIGNGAGTITSTPTGINCTYNGTVTSGTCTANFPPTAQVTLTATPNTTPNSSFAGWFGFCGVLGTATCQTFPASGATTTAVFSVPPQPFAQGQVFAGAAGGMIFVYNPDGTLVQVLGSGNLGGDIGGIAFDTSGNLYAANPTAVTGGITGTVERWGSSGAGPTIFGTGPLGNGYDASPQSVVVSPTGDVYVAQSGGRQSLLKFPAAGGPASAEYFPPDDTGAMQWIELLDDNSTMLYTTSSKIVKSFDVLDNIYHPDFAMNLPGPGALSLREVSDKTVLVADADRIVRVSPAGAVLNTYQAGTGIYHSVNLDPDGATFWTLEDVNGTMFRININTGAIITQFPTGVSLTLDAFNGFEGGLAVFGQPQSGGADVQVTMSASPSPATQNSPLTYTIVVKNNGLLTATSVAMSDAFPAGATVVSKATTQGTCNGAGIVTCAIGTLANGASATITIVVTPTTVGTLTNTANANSNTPDPISSDNSATTNTTVNGVTLFPLQVNTAGTGTGTVTGNGIACTSGSATGCTVNLAPGTLVTLIEGTTGSTFAGWAGTPTACTVSGAMCTFTMPAIAETVTATFTAAVGPTLKSIAVTPLTPAIRLGQTQQFTATGTFSDGSTQDLTTTATWTSSLPAVATISNTAGTQGLASAIADGSTLITATQSGVIGSGALTVAPAVGFVLTGNLITKRSLPKATLLNNGNVLISGGVGATNFTILASAELYNPLNGMFTATGNMTTPRFNNTATLLPNGMVLFAGGANGLPSTSAELYNPATGTFSATGSMNVSRFVHSATLLPNGTVLIAGGFTGNARPFTALASAETYDPATGIFTPTAGNLTVAGGGSATLLNTGKVLIVGPNFANLYDPATGMFTTTGGASPLPAGSATTTLLNNGKVLFAGGLDASANAAAAGTLYDPATGTFAATGSLITARFNHSATLLSNGMVLIVGGYVGNNINTFFPLASAELYDPAAGTFAETSSLNVARDDQTETLLDNGIVLVAGGDNTNTNGSGDALTSAELYAPSTMTPPGLTSIAVTPANPIIPVGTFQRFVATGTFTAGGPQTLASVIWSSSNTNVATITNDVGSKGFADDSPGTTTVTAAAGAISGSTLLTVIGPATHFAVSAPANATAGTPIDVTVTAQDVANNIATGYTGTVAFTSTDGSAILQPDTKLTNGVGTFPATLKTAGNQTITATDTVTATINGTSGTIVVTSVQNPQLIVQIAGTGSGAVTGNGVFCGSGSTAGCAVSLASGTAVALTQTALNGSTFAGWTAAPTACTVAGAVCSLSMPAGTETVTATFTSSPVPLFTGATLPPGAVTVPYGADIQVSGGVPPYTFAVANGSTLPAGFTLVPTASGNIAAGHIFSNGPAVSNTFMFGIKVTDSTPAAPQSATATISLTIGAAPPNTQPGLLKGPYALLLRGFSENGSGEGDAGSLNFDGKNAITGVVDVNNSSGVQPNVPVTGSYSIGPDNRGVMTLTTASGSITLAFAVGGVYRGVATGARVTQFIDNDGNDRVGSGFLFQQDSTAFNPDSFAGTYAFSVTGQSPNLERVALVGLTTLDNKLNIVSGSGDVSVGGTLGSVTSIVGNYTTPDANTGRTVFTATLTPGGATTRVAYIVSQTQFVLLTSDNTGSNDLLLGTAMKQMNPGSFTNTSIAGPDVVTFNGFSSGGGGNFDTVIGRATVNAGTLSVTFDENDAGSITTGGTVTGTPTILANGRGSVTLGATGIIFYLAAPDRGFTLGAGTGVETGVLLPQVGAPFSATPIAGNLYLGLEEAISAASSHFSGIGVLAPANTLTVTSDDSESGGNLFYKQGIGSFVFAGDPNGHFTTASGPMIGTITGYVVSPFEIALFDTNGPLLDPTPSSHPNLILLESILAPPGAPSPAATGVNFPAPVAIGSNAQSAAITITNSGLGPLGITGQNTGNSPDFSASGPCLAAALVVIPPGGTCTFIVTFAPTANTATAVLLTETLLLTTDGGNITITATGTAAGTGANLAITKTGPTTAAPSSSATYTIVITNNGPQAATSIGMSDPLPSPLMLPHIIAPATGCSASENMGTSQWMVGCSFATLANGASITIMYSVNLPASGTLTNTATVTAANDSNPDNSASVTTTIGGTGPTLTSIAVTPNPAAMPLTSNGNPATLQFTATGHFSDGSTQDITNTVTWTESNGQFATISNAANSQGLATALARGGPTTITATQGAISGATLLAVGSVVVANPALNDDKQRVDGGTPALQIVLTNTSATQTVHFTQNGVSADNPKYTVTSNCTTLAPGSTCTVVAGFTTTAFCGNQATTITVADDDPLGDVQFKLNGYGADTGLLVTDLTSSNFLVNGSFETPAAPVGGFSNFGSGSTGIAGWTVVGAPGGVSIVSGAFSQNGVTFPAEAGSQWLDLTGDGTNGVEGVEQTVATIAGTQYTLSFWVGNAYDPGGIFGTTSTVKVMLGGINGTLLGTATNSIPNPGIQTWQQFSMTFTATGASTTIDLINGDPSSDNNNGLDNVVLTAGGLSLPPAPNPTLTAQQLAQSIVGQGVQISNVKYTGAPLAAGTFNSATNILGFTNGVVLSTGSVRNVVGPNCSTKITGDNNQPGDTDLNNLLGPGATTNDAAVLEFDFVPTGPTISVQYVFGSDEYNEFVGQFNDVLGFFLNGTNIAVVPGTSLPVSINNVNKNLNSTFFINNDFQSPAAAPLDTEMDGLTVVLTAQGQVTPNQTNHIKLAIADATNFLVDSNVFISSGSLLSSSVSFSPTAVAFGNQTVGVMSSGQIVTLSNSGTTAVSISSIAATPPFQQTSNCPAQLAPAGQAGATCMITVTITPSRATSFTGSLTVTDNSPNSGSQQSIALSGTGRGAAAATHFTVTAPGTVTAGTSFNITLTALTASNAVATGYTGLAHFTTTDGNAVLPGNQALVNGTGTFSARLGTVGNQTITATDTVTASITGTSGPINVTAVAAPVLTVQIQGTGAGTVTGAGINCTSGSANGCTANVTPGTQVTLTETFGTNSSFTSWSAPCPNTTGPSCTFAMPAVATMITATFTLNAPTLVSIAVTPANPTVPISSTQQFTATGTYSDKSTKDITGTVTWASSNGDAASINAAGLALTGLTPDLNTTISASLNEVTGSTTLTVSSSPISISVTPPVGGVIPPVPPGGKLAVGIVLTATPGFSGTVTFSCTVTGADGQPAPSITCLPDPNTVTLSPGGPTQEAIVVNTFCTADTVPLGGPNPGGFPGGLGLLLLSLTLGGAVCMYRRSPRMAISFAVLVLFALGGAACSSLPKGPNGVTPPGNYVLTISASVNGTTVVAPPIDFTVQ